MDVILAAVSSPGPLLAQASAGLTNNQIVLILFIAGLSALLLITTRRRLRRAQNSPEAYAREQVSRLRSEQSLMEEMGEVMVQLEQFSRESQARLDTKFAKLESILRDADQRIDRLERLVRQADGERALDVTIDGSPPVASASLCGDDSARHEAVFRLADAGLAPDRIAEETDQSLGEVELILALRKASASAASPS